MYYFFDNAPASKPLPLDELTGITPSAAYSLRKLTKRFMGAPVRVRRSSDNTEMDIPFCGVDLCKATLESFVGAENKFLYSGDISNAIWTKTWNTTVYTPNYALAPNGTMTAYKVDFSALNDRFNQAISGTGQHTMSIYAKVESGTRDFKMQFFNGTDTDTTETKTATTEWQRFTFTRSPSLNSTWYISAQGAGAIIFWGIQINTGATAKTYNETGVGVGGNGFISTWYGQSGNGNNAVQTTASAQPRIVNAGVILVGTSGKPSLTWAETTNSISLTSPSLTMQQVAIVTRYSTGIQSTWLYNTQGLFGMGASIIGIIGANAGLSVWYGVNAFNTVAKNGGAEANINGNTAIPLPESVLVARASSPQTEALIIGQDRTIVNRGWSGTISEVIAFPTTLTDTQRQKLEKNQGKYYGVAI